MYTVSSPSPYMLSAQHTVAANTRQFDFDTLRRVPVTVSPDARAFLDRGNHQARLLPQALAEFYGEMADVTGLVIELEQGEDSTSSGSGEQENPAPAPPQPMTLLAITVQHARYEDHLHRIGVEDLTHFHSAFRAAHMAEELRRLSHDHYHHVQKRTQPQWVQASAQAS